MFDRQPTLTDDTYTLRPLREDDRPALRMAASDPLIWAGHPVKDRYKPEVFNALFDSLLAFEGALLISRGEAVIGTSTYYTGSTQPGTIAIGYTFLTRAYWGGTANLAVKTLMLDYAFTYYDSVWLHIGPDNIRSQKATAKLGAVYTHTETMQTNAGPTDMQFWHLDRSAWRDRVGH